MHTFSAIPPSRENIHPDWVGKLTAVMCAKHLGGLEGDGTSALRPPLTQASSNHMTIAVQNVTGSCNPYHIAGFPNDDCRFAAWTAMVKSGIVDIAFLVDAHCSPVDIQRCQAYTRAVGDVASRGAPTTTQTSRRLTDPAEGLPAMKGIQSGGILMLISPALQSKIIHTTHRCSGRLFLVHLRHDEDELVIVALYGVSAPQTDDKKAIRAQLAAAMAQVHQTYSDIPMLVVGDLNAAASSDDRGSDGLTPYDRETDALTNVLTRLSFTDVHRHKFPPSRHYTWSNSRGHKSRIDAVYANAHALTMAGGVHSFKSSIGNSPGPLGTDHSPVFARFRSPMATPSDGSLPMAYSPPPAAPTRWCLDDKGAESYHDMLLQWPQHEHLSEMALGRAAFLRARRDVYPLAYAASVLELDRLHDTSQVCAAAARALRSRRHTSAHVTTQTQLITSHMRTLDPPQFDARACIQQYEEASATWHASLAAGLREAYGRAKQHKRPTPPRPSRTEGPTRTHLAMRVCHHWHKLRHARWGPDTPLASREVLLRRLHHVHEASNAWGSATPPPQVAPDWGDNDQGVWDTWSRDVIPTLQRFLTLSGIAHIKGSFCTHPVGNETRLPSGPSLGGALRPGGTNTMIDGLLLPDQETGRIQWNCSDTDLRRHMANEIMKLSSDKTVPSATATCTTYPFTKVAKEVLFDPDNSVPCVPQPATERGDADHEAEPTTRESPHVPAPPHTARTRGHVNVARLDALRLAIESSLHLSWSDMDTWTELQSISQQAKPLGFSVPPWVKVMDKVITTRLLRFDLNEHSRQHADLSKCTLTHILMRYSSAVPDPFPPEVALQDPALGKSTRPKYKAPTKYTAKVQGPGEVPGPEKGTKTCL